MAIFKLELEWSVFEQILSPRPRFSFFRSNSCLKFEAVFFFLNC